MADDLDFDYKQDRLSIMSNLQQRIRNKGVQFINHVAAQPVCGPSRSSFLAGRYPHNVGYLVNKEPQSVLNWERQQNNTIGTWMTNRGYYTAFLGKYVNGMEDQVPSGWNHWGGFSTHLNTYNFYNATIWNVTFDDSGTKPISPITWTAMTGIHQADFLGQFAVDQMKNAQTASKPFFISVTPTMVHAGTCYGPYSDPNMYAFDDPYWEGDLRIRNGCRPKIDGHCSMGISPCPTIRNKHAFDNLANPHVPSWNQSASGVMPQHMRNFGPITPYETIREDIGYRNRTSSVLDLDEMLGVILDGIDALGVADNTYVIFTSDNGYHLGEHRLLLGKEHPYDTDVRLPFYMRGPGIPAGSTRHHPTNHVDVTATIVELAGAKPVGQPLDGKSFRNALTSKPIPPEQWRNFSFSEFFTNADTWWKIRWSVPNGEITQNTSFHWWCTDQAEVYDFAKDPWELTNLVRVSERGDKIRDLSLPLAVFLGSCSGPTCSTPTPVPVHPTPLKCHTVENPELYASD